jgi:hypothetical protein
VVAQITEGTAFDKHGRPFRRRNFLPGILLLVALSVATMLVWVIALSRPPDVREAAVCNPPPPAANPGDPTLGEQVSRATMTEVTPARPGAPRRPPSGWSRPAPSCSKTNEATTAWT